MKNIFTLLSELNDFLLNDLEDLKDAGRISICDFEEFIRFRRILEPRLNKFVAVNMETGFDNNAVRRLLRELREYIEANQNLQYLFLRWFPHHFQKWKYINQILFPTQLMGARDIKDPSQEPQLSSPPLDRSLTTVEESDLGNVFPVKEVEGDLGVLGGPSDGQPKREVTQDQYVNLEFIYKDEDDPFEVGEKYTLTIDIDLELRKGALRGDGSTGRVDPLVYEEGEDEVELGILLVSKDFSIDQTEILPLKLEKGKKSKESLCYLVEPLSEGPAKFSVLIFKGSALVQQMNYSLMIGTVNAQLSTPEVLGRGLGALKNIITRDLTLIIHDLEKDNEFLFMLKDNDSSTSSIWELHRIPPEDLHEWIMNVRNTIHVDIASQVYINKENKRTRPYRSREIKIPKALAEKSNRILAKAGYDLFKKIFYDSISLDSELKIGKELINYQKGGHKLKFQIDTLHFLMPWGVLYISEDLDENNIDVNKFLGMTHIIEHKLRLNVEYQTEVSPNIVLPANEALSVNLIFDGNLDETSYVKLNQVNCVKVCTSIW